jgi:hypothetical protein
MPELSPGSVGQSASQAGLQPLNLGPIVGRIRVVTDEAALRLR